MTFSPELALTARPGLPDALRVLVAEYPREGWETHSAFSGLVQFWLQRHMKFRQLSDLMVLDARSFSDNALAFEEYAPRLSQFAGTLLNELRQHHHIEDHHYFPKLVNLDARVALGFDLLEADHEAMDGLLHEMTEGANAVLRGGSDIGPFLERLDRFSGLLERHLTDEEEIIVPVILHSGFKG